MSGYTNEAKEYWEDAIKRDDRFTSVGIRYLPECINQRRKEKLYPIIRNIIQQEFSELNGEKVLDAGCGTGVYSEFYGSQGGDVTGVDLSERAVSFLKTNVEGNFYQSKLNDLPLGDNLFQLTHCFSVLYHIVDDSEWQESISELVRVTKPGGIIVLRIAWQQDTDSPANHVKHRSINQYLRVLSRENACRLESIHTFNDIPEYSSLIKIFDRIGLENCQERLCSWIISGNRFKTNPQQRVAVFRVLKK